MFALEVTFLTGRYVATAFDNRNRGEWPPHPARLFSTLAATYFESPDRLKEERDALDWIERLGPPQIAASAAGEREVVTVFVPVNDTSVVADVEDEAKALEDARSGVERARAASAKELVAAEKKLLKAQARFVEAVRRNSGAVPTGKEGKDGPARAASVLPDHRPKQPRTFPSVCPDVPRVVFAWPGAEPTAEMRTTIDGLTARVVRLGHSSSLISVRMPEEVPAATWIPDTTGELRPPSDECVLRVVEPGQMSGLESVRQEQLDEPGRVMPAAFQRYVRQDPASDAPAPTTVFGQDWIVLRRLDGPRLPSVRTVDVARTVRKALLQAYGANAPEILSGHGSPEKPSSRRHLAIVPLPFVGHAKADGSLLGVALVLPAGVSADERRAVIRAVNSWREARQQDDDQYRLPVHLGPTGTLTLTPVDATVAQSTLMPRTWCARSRFWTTATPIALDRNPGDLRSKDVAKESQAYAAAEETIATSCERIGLPRPATVTAVVAAPLAGGDKVRLFPTYQAGNPAIQRVLVHARLTFEVPVEGPILLGAGRYVGLGLLRPVTHHD